MTSYLGHEQETLRRAVGEVLHYIWDPIGVAGAVMARDEYDGYVDGVFDLVWAGATAAEVSNHLAQIAKESMGISGTSERADCAAAKLLEWRDACTR